MDIVVGETTYKIYKRDIKIFMKAVENYNAVSKILKLYKNFRDIENNYKDFSKWAEEVKFLEDKNIEIKTEDYSYKIMNKNGEYELGKLINIYDKDKIIYENISIETIKEIIDRYI